MLTIEEMRAAERSYVDAGGNLNELTRLAGCELARAIIQQFPVPGKVVAYTGKGNNAADALIALGHLRDAGWQVALRQAYAPSDCVDFTRQCFEELDAENLELAPNDLACEYLLLDGLLGIGAEGELRSPLLELVAEMNRLRDAGRARVVAVDVPTGVNADTGEASEFAVRADLTCCIGDAKIGLLDSDAVNHVGRIAVLSLPGFEAVEHPELEPLSSKTLEGLLPIRSFDMHKGVAGRLAIIAGSQGMWGAANLCARGALRAGAGLVTVYCKRGDSTILEVTKPDEVIVKAVDSFLDVAADRFDALVIGPGMVDLPEADAVTLWKLIQNTTAPLILDAGGLFFGLRRGWNMQMPANSIITPHPGEMNSLFKSLGQLPRIEQIRRVIAEGKGTLVLKGSRTLVGRQGKRIQINTTGGPAMAGAGQGDALSGVIGAFAARGLDCFDAARLGVWIAGRAGERACARLNEHSVISSDSIAEIAGAISDYFRGIY